MRLLLLRSLLVLFAVCLSLPLVEIALRLTPAPAAPSISEEPTDSLWADPEWRGPPPSVFQPDAAIGFTYAPHVQSDIKVAEHQGGAFRFRTNDYGLRRDDEVAIPKPAGMFRVLVLGDSQTSGYGTNEETYPGHLETLAQERAGGQLVEVVNGGVDGYSPQQAYLWLRKYGVPLQPDLVIFAVYAGNDVADLVQHTVDAAVIDDAAGLLGPLRTPLAWLGLHSELYKRTAPLVQGTLPDALDRLGIVKRPPPLVPQDPLVRLLRECHGCWFQTIKQALRVRTEPAATEVAYRRMETLFRLLQANAAEHGGRVAVLLIPTKPQVEPRDEAGALGRATRLLELTPEDLDYDNVAYERIRSAAAAANVPLIDPLADLRETAERGAAEKRRLYYRRDWHLNPNGNQALAVALDRALTAGGMVPWRAP